MGWLREKFKNIESRIDIAGERFEGSITKLKEKERIRKEEKRKHEEELRKRNWEDLNWFQKSLKIILILIIAYLTICIIFWVIAGPPLWKFLCKLWQLFISYCVWKQMAG